MKIGISYIFWSLVYCIKDKFIKDIKLNEFILNFINFIDGHYHLWFLFFIIILYMMVPFLLLIVKNRVLLNYFLILSFISTFLFQNIILYSKYFIKKNIIEIMEKIYSKLNNKYISGNIFYFILEYYLNKVNTKHIKLEIIIYFFGLIGMIFGAKISSYLSHKKKKKSKIFIQVIQFMFYFKVFQFLFFLKIILII